MLHKPTVYADDLTKDCQQMNELTDVVVTYDFSDRKETVDRSVIKNWLTKDENDDLVLDKAVIADYISELAKKYDTVGTERTFLLMTIRKLRYPVEIMAG